MEILGLETPANDGKSGRNKAVNSTQDQEMATFIFQNCLNWHFWQEERVVIINLVLQVSLFLFFKAKLPRESVLA